MSENIFVIFFYKHVNFLHILLIGLFCIMSYEIGFQGFHIFVREASLFVLPQISSVRFYDLRFENYGAFKNYSS